jgi:hypothetical protein
MRALADVRDEATDTPLVGRSTRTIRRWVTTVGERLYADTGDDGWTHLGPPRSPADVGYPARRV